MAVSKSALRKVLLVVIFRFVKRARGLNACRHRPAESTRCLERSFRCSGGLLLFGRMEEDYTAVLRSHIGALAIYLGRIVSLPEYVQELIVADLRRIVLYLDDFSMPG